MANTVEDMMVAGVMAGTVHVLSSIVRILEQSNLLQPNEFAAVMDQAANNLKPPRGSPFPPNFPRTDVQMLRRLAELLKRSQRGWKPIVIDGGLTPPENQ